MKGKTLGWKFRIIHILGRMLFGPDALSRAVEGQQEVLLMTWGQGIACTNQTQLGESYYNLQAGHIDNITAWEHGQEAVNKVGEGRVLGMIRASMSGEFTLPEPNMDASECLLASIELGVKSVSWAMVKNELSVDGGYKDLADCITGGRAGPPYVLPDHIRLYWRVRAKLRLHSPPFCKTATSGVEHVCVDYMSLKGHQFGMFIDRYTGWPGVFVARLCEDYGVPVSRTSDGAPN
jgi:hypothetical protein